MIDVIAYAMIAATAAAATGTDEQGLQLRGTTATAYDAADQPVLIGSREYILGWANNPLGLVFESDPFRGRVRVSGNTAPAVWLKCAEISSAECQPPTPSAVRDRTRSVELPEMPGETAARVPTCPGDPRCPQ